MNFRSCVAAKRYQHAVQQHDVIEHVLAADDRYVEVGGDIRTRHTDRILATDVLREVR